MGLNSFSCPHEDATLTGSQFLSEHFQFRTQTCRKPVKTAKIRYIRYNSKIRYIQIVPNRFSIDWVCFGQFDTLRSTNARVVPMLHAVQAWL